MKKKTWLVLHVVEQMAVLAGHASLTSEQIKNGPHYSAGSKWYNPATERNRQHMLFQAEALRKQGLTCLVYTETRVA